MANPQPSKYSKWQLRRIRHALLAYYMYGEKIADDNSHLDQRKNFDADAEMPQKEREIKRQKLNKVKRLNWFDVRRAIQHVTGVSIGDHANEKKLGNRLSSFCNSKSGLQDDWIDTVCEFLMHKSVGLLTPEDLIEEDIDLKALVNVAEYYNHDYFGADNINLERIEGGYWTYSSSDDEAGHKGIIYKEILIKRPSKLGVAEVVEVHEIYDEGIRGGSLSTYKTIRLRTAVLNRRALKKFSGWVILTPEDNLIFYMKNTSNGLNRNTITFDSDLEHTVDAPLGTLFLLEYDLPIEQKKSAYLERVDISTGRTLALLLQKRIAKYVRIEQ